MSTGTRDTQAVKRLIAEVIDSFEKLEIVAHVQRAGFGVIAAQDIATSLGLPTDEVDKCVAALRRARAFEPAGPWREAIDTLVAMYDDDRIEVLNLMTRTALERVRKQAATVFADAFVIRPKNPKKGDPDA